MATSAELLQAIRASMGSAIVPSLTDSSAGSDLFEAYLWTLVVEAAQRQNAVVTYVNVTGQPQVFTFPTSPRSIFSPTAYSFARLDFASCPSLEAHLDVFVSGRSRVPHECDIAVIDAGEALLCRQQRVHPRRSKVLLAIECKFYSGVLKLDEARAFLGLLEEIQRPDRFLVTNAFSRNVVRMLAKHRCGWEANVVPNATAVNNIRAQFETVFKNYCAQYR